MSDHSEDTYINANETLVNSESTHVQNSSLSDIPQEENEHLNYESINDINVEYVENIVERVEISKLGYSMFVVFGLTMLCAW